MVLYQADNVRHSALKLQMQPMLLSTSYNSLATVLSNLNNVFTTVALKAYHYIRSLPAAKQPSSRLIVSEYRFFSYHMNNFRTFINISHSEAFTFGHKPWNIEDPVRSPELKPWTG
jgi:hypothetical protein